MSSLRECAECAEAHLKMMRALADELESWAQNEEMVEQGYTQHGKCCILAADLLRSYGETVCASMYTTESK